MGAVVTVHRVIGRACSALAPSRRDAAGGTPSSKNGGYCGYRLHGALVLPTVVIIPISAGDTRTSRLCDPVVGSFHCTGGFACQRVGGRFPTRRPWTWQLGTYYSLVRGVYPSRFSVALGVTAVQ